MDIFLDSLFLSRLQFALTTIIHIIWPVLSIGLSLFLLIIEILWFKTGREVYYRHARFWSRLFLLNFGVGVVTGIPLEFQFGTNWAPFSIQNGDFFGNILGFEAAMAFMLEAGFLGIMLFGWDRVAPGVHLFSTAMVAFGASLSAFWIMAANAWMQTPDGVHLENGRLVVDSYSAAIFNPSAFTSITHMWVASVETTLFLIGGISAWHLLKNRHREFYLISFRLVLLSAIVIAPLQIVLGELSGNVVATHQPAKLAAMEAHWQTNLPGQGAPWVVLAWPDREKQANTWAIEIPYGLSLLTTRSLTGKVTGLRDIPKENQPPVVLPFYAFRLMIIIGFALALLMLWSAWVFIRKRLTLLHIGRQRLLLRAWVASAPLGYIAVEAGWITREVGRQPWIIYGMMRTEDAATSLPAGLVMTSLAGYALIYGLLLFGYLFFAKRIISQGPDLTSPLPEPEKHSPSPAGAGPALEDRQPLGGD
ncbi:MAG: cytochrome ubiquinol oxidase subunit I [Methylobacter sp.]